jgi:hypothetical protein
MKKKETCIVKNCKGKVIGRFSPDLDIKGISFCKKHKTLVAGAYISLMNGDEGLFERITGQTRY